MGNYVCPCCKGELSREYCSECDFSIQWDDGIATFLSDSPVAVRYREIGDFYDGLYGSREHVWKDVASRGDEFTRFMAELVNTLSPRRYLDLGCGEGFLLGEVSASEKSGTEISRAAIRVAARRSDSEFCRACAEELPYPDDYFDVVTSVGVTEHCVDDLAATMEVNRVLRPGGRYLMGVTVEGKTLAERFRLKVEDYVYPRFRPIALSRWAMKKYVRPDPRARVIQPIMHRYTPEALLRQFDRAGFSVVNVVTRQQRQELIAAFRIYVLEK